MLVILFLNYVYYISHLDIVSYSRVALCGMIVTLLVSSVSFVLLIGYLCLFLPHGLTNEDIISIFICSCCKHICFLVNNKIIPIFLSVIKIT